MNPPSFSGDQVSRKGTLTGGYYDSRRSRLEMQRQIWEHKEQLEAAEGEKAELRQQLEDIPLVQYSLNIELTVFRSSWLTSAVQGEL